MFKCITAERKLIQVIYRTVTTARCRYGNLQFGIMLHEIVCALFYNPEIKKISVEIVPSFHMIGWLHLLNKFWNRKEILVGQ